MLTDYAYQALHSKHTRLPEGVKGPYNNGELLTVVTQQIPELTTPIHVAAQITDRLPRQLLPTLTPTCEATISGINCISLLRSPEPHLVLLEGTSNTWDNSS